MQQRLDCCLVDQVNGTGRICRTHLHSAALPVHRSPELCPLGDEEHLNAPLCRSQHDGSELLGCFHRFAAQLVVLLQPAPALLLCPLEHKLSCMLE